MTSQNIPVAETNSTAAGTSLQLTGSGSQYAHFTWAESAKQTFGACNNGQTFSGTGGTGLGLAIAKKSIQRVNGELSARNGTPHGLLITIELPGSR